MVKIGRARTAHLVLLCAVLTAGSVVFAVSAADAGPLEGVTAPVKEAVAPVAEVTETVTAPVKELTEPVAHPVEEATETVTQPVHEVTETVGPPVHEVTETVTQPVRETTETVAQPVKETVKPVAKQATETVGSSPATAPVKAAAGGAGQTATNTAGAAAGGPAKNAGTAAHEATGTATHTAQGAANSVIDAAPSTPAAGRDATTGTYAGAPAGRVTGQESGGPGAAAVDLGPGKDTFEVPSVDGSVRAPLGKVTAYVWPAIALTDPALAALLEGRGGRNLLIALYKMAGVPGTGQIHVAGAAASSAGAGTGPSSNRSLFSQIPSAIGEAFTADVPLPAMVFLLVVALGVIALAAAMMWDLGVVGDFFARRRRRRSWR
jgi:hypothetical protein